MTFDDLWPLPIPKVTVVTGPYGCGKSTFALGSGAEMEEHLVVDFEKSRRDIQSNYRSPTWMSEAS